MSNRLVAFEQNYEDRKYDRENNKIEKKFFILDKDMRVQSIKEIETDEYIIEEESNFAGHSMTHVTENDW